MLRSIGKQSGGIRGVSIKALNETLNCANKNVFSSGNFFDLRASAFVYSISSVTRIVVQSTCDGSFGMQSSASFVKAERRHLV